MTESFIKGVITLDDALNIVQNNRIVYAPDATMQAMLSDKNGRVLIIEPGLGFRLEQAKYSLITNYSVLSPEITKPYIVSGDDRFERADELLKSCNDSFSVGEAFQILKSVKQEGLWATRVSFVYSVNENKVYYATDKNSQAKYISMYTNKGIDVLLLDKVLDTQFVSYLESKNEKVKFLRVDSALDESLSKENADEIPELKNLFENIAGDKVKIEFSSLEDKVPLIITVSEESRRMSDMMKMYGMDSAGMPEDRTLIINTSSPLNAKISDILSSAPDKAEKLAKYLYSLAKMSQSPFNNEELITFLNDSYDIIELI